MTKRRFTILGHWIDVEVRPVKPIRYCSPDICGPMDPHHPHLHAHRLPGEADLDMGDYILRAEDGNYVRVFPGTGDDGFFFKAYFSDDYEEAIDELGQ